MPQITLTFRFLDAANQAVDSTPSDLVVINSLGLTEVASPNPQTITGQRNIEEPDPCANWAAIFNFLNVPFNIFSDMGVTAVVRDNAPCIGSLIADNAVTLFLKRHPIPVAVAPAIEAGAEAGEVVVLGIIQQIGAFLNGQTNIRVYIPASLSRGHQSTTCLIIRRLIALGYAGAFEVIYVNNGDNATTIKKLLPELQLVVVGQNINPGATPYRNAALGNCLFTFTPKGSGALLQRQFGISGGVDDPNDNPTVFCSVEYFLMLQPFQWNAANYLYHGQDRTDLGNVPALNRLEFVGATCYYMDIAIYAWAIVSPEVARINNAQIRNAVTAIQANCCAAESTTHLLPVYGLHATVEDGWILFNWVGQGVRQINALANTVLAVLRGQANAPLNLATVILTFDTYEDAQLTSLQALLPQNYHARLTYWSPANGDWDNALITDLEANQILIINIPGGLAAPLFNYFYLNSSLPPIFEGKGTMPIMLNSGRPYLQLSKQTDGFDTIISLNLDVVVRRLKVFLYPSIPYVYSLPTANVLRMSRTEQNARATACFEAEKAIVWNTPPNITISRETFQETDENFTLIQIYLLANNYINATNRVQNKFMALLASVDFEDAGFPLATITKLKMFNDMQVVCGAAALAYQTKIDLLSTYFRNAITPDSEIRNYFTALGTHFHDQTNDKLVKGLGVAIAAINA